MGNNLEDTMGFKDELAGERIVLKRNMPTQKMAKIMFEAVDSNREHLRPWFPWEKMTQKVKKKFVVKLKKYLENI